MIDFESVSAIFLSPWNQVMYEAAPDRSHYTVKMVKRGKNKQPLLKKYNVIFFNKLQCNYFE